MMSGGVHIEMDTDCILFRSMVQKIFFAGLGAVFRKGSEEKVILDEGQRVGKDPASGMSQEIP